MCQNNCDNIKFGALNGGSTETKTAQQLTKHFDSNTKLSSSENGTIRTTEPKHGSKNTLIAIERKLATAVEVVVGLHNWIKKIQPTPDRI